MPIDPASTTPGLPPSQETLETVHMKCKNPNCDSITAFVVKIPGQTSNSVRLYRCTKCHASKVVNVGGGIDL